MKKAVIFDMDGVLIDSEPIYLDWFLHFFGQCGVPVSRENLAKLAGASSTATWDIVGSLWNEPADPMELKARFKSFESLHVMPYRDILFPGVKPLLERLTEMRCTLALASSSSPASIDSMLNETGTGPYFSLTVSGRMFRESKPNPEIYLYTLEQLGLPAGDCLVVEDSTYGIQAAKAAGIAVAAILDHRFGYDQTAADYLVGDILEVVDCLDGGPA